MKSATLEAREKRVARNLSVAGYCLQFSLAFNVGLLIGHLYRHKWWLALLHLVLTSLSLFGMMATRRCARLAPYLKQLMWRCRQVSEQRIHLGLETCESIDARYFALRLAIDRSYESIWRKPWGAVEPAARDLELFGVPIGEHPLPDETVEWRTR